MSYPMFQGLAVRGRVKPSRSSRLFSGALAALLVSSAAACDLDPTGPEVYPIASAPTSGEQLLLSVETAPAGSVDQVVTGLLPASGLTYNLGVGLKAGSRAYSDRVAAYQRVPAALQGQHFIQTASQDQDISRNSRLVTFTLGEEATLFVAYNSASNFPGWLSTSGFTNTGDSLVVEADGAARSYTLWSRVFAAGEVRLGSNRPGDNTALMYTVVIRPTAQRVVRTVPIIPDFSPVVQGIRPRGFGQGSYALAQPAAGGTMYWVAPSGNDSHAGSSAQPFRTINRAAQLARAGDVVTVRAGTYRESVSVLNAGTAERPIVFQAEERGQVVLTGGQYTFQPRGWTSGRMQNGPIHVTLRGLVFRAYATEQPTSTRHQAAVGAIRGWRIEDCLFDRAGYHGLDIRGDSVIVERSTFQYNHTNAISAWTHKGTELLGLVVRDVVLRGNNARPDPIPVGGANTRVAKYWGTNGTLVDNIESYENEGPGFWFDTDNRNYVVRNSYFHSNRGEAGRGLYIEVNPKSNGLIQNNVFANNNRQGLALSSSEGVRVVGNMIVNNERCISLIFADRGADYPLADIEVSGNFCKAWRMAPAIQRAGEKITTPAQMNIRFDRNVYDPAGVAELTFWNHTGWVRSLTDMQSKLGWEKNGFVFAFKAPV
jgi:hypothetical protein